MLLDGKVAMIFGAGGAFGGAVAKAFVRKAAEVFLSGRNGAPQPSMRSMKRQSSAMLLKWLASRRQTPSAFGPYRACR